MYRIRAIFFATAILLAGACSLAGAISPSQEKETGVGQYDDKLNFYVANDLGRNGYYDQKPIAELMGEMAEEVDPEFVAALGDVHHFNGVRSVDDPLWMTNYELVYSHPDLMLAWYPILGNHEYRGNTQAVLDYSKVSARWEMQDKYYCKVIEDEGTSVRLVMIDTTPIIDKYREDSEKYPDACKEDYTRQLHWLDSVLTIAQEQWVIVMGHHPIYAQSSKDVSEQSDMRERVDSILRRHQKKVKMYISGHLHNFQHVKVKGCSIDYITNSSASLSRKAKVIEGTEFCSGETGFSIVTASPQELVLRMVDKTGKVLHTITHKAH